MGRVDGTPVRIDRHYVEADVRILTGFVEPHFFAGFSGGPKGACPGLAGLETILEAHSPRRISDPRATWLVTEGNPVHDFVRAAVALAPPAFSVDVAINQRRQLTAVFGGPLPHGHSAACRFVEETSVQSVGARFDVVLSTNGGYPLDRNLYQAVKGMAAAERVVRAGGTIVMAAECLDGTPDGGSFARHPGRGAGPPGGSVPGTGCRRPTGGRPRCSVGSSAMPRSGCTPTACPTTPSGVPSSDPCRT